MCLSKSIHPAKPASRDCYPPHMAKRPSKPDAREPAAATSAEIPLGPECRVALFFGPEVYLRHGYTDQIKAAVEKAGQEVQVVRFDGVTAQPADVLDECRSMALLAPYKIVIVDDADQLITPKKKGDDESESDDEDSKDTGKRRAMLERYVQSPCDNVTLVLRSEGWRKGNLDKYAAKVGVVRECKPLDEGRAANWTAARAKQKYGRSIHVDAVELLVSSLNRDLARIDGELMKLAGATKEGEAITAALVESLVTPVAQERKPWELGDVLLNPNPAGAMSKLHELVDRCGIDPILLRWTSLDTATKLHWVAQEIARGVPPAGAGRSIKFFFGPRAEASRRVGKDAGAKACSALLRECVEADWKAKTGQGDAFHGMEALVLSFARTAALNAGRQASR